MAIHRIKRDTLTRGKPNCVRLEGDKHVVVWDDGAEVRVYSEVCPHMGGPLGQGKYDEKRRTLTCPWHGWQYDVTSGKLTMNPAVGVKCYPLEVKGEDIWVDLG